MSVQSLTWELLSAKQQALLLPLMKYAVSNEQQLPGDNTCALPETTFAHLWEAWNDLDRLALSDWALTEGTLKEVTDSLRFLSEEAPDVKVSEIVCYYSH